MKKSFRTGTLQTTKYDTPVLSNEELNHTPYAEVWIIKVGQTHDIRWSMQAFARRYPAFLRDTSTRLSEGLGGGGEVGRRGGGVPWGGLSHGSSI